MQSAYNSAWLSVLAVVMKIVKHPSRQEEYEADEGNTAACTVQQEDGQVNK